MAVKKANQAEYGDQSITVLSGKDRVRYRPAVMFGSDDLGGCEHSFLEILANAVDEAREGYGDKITVTRYKDFSLQVEDDGRGVPLGFNEAAGRWNWELVFAEMYAGGKYNNNKGDSAYEFSLGTNGLGAAATQYSSTYMVVQSFKGGEVSEMHFEGGDPVGELSVKPLSAGMKKHGSIIRWQPDLAVFKEIDIPKVFFERILRQQSFVNAGVRFCFDYENEDGFFDHSEYYYENGIADYIEEITDGIALTAPVLWKMETAGRDRPTDPEYKVRAEVAFCFATSGMAEYYHNSSYLEHGGSTEKAVKAAFTDAIANYIRLATKAGKGDQSITFADIADNLTVIVNSASTDSSYENQTKKAVTNSFIQTSLTSFLRGKLDAYFAENQNSAAIIANQVIANKRSRESIDKTKGEIKKKLTGTMDVTGRVEKFIPCSSKDVTMREIYIVEGDSAASSCTLARNAEFQAVMPIRGKTLNCMKSGYEKIFANDIIVDLLRVIGCGTEITAKGKPSDISLFRPELLKWNKIIICTDADEDGFQIRTLLLTLFYRLLPSLIAAGKIFIAESPLFEITCGKDTYFAYNEPEKTEILRKLEGKKYSIQRSKGLGENEPDMMSRTTMCPQTRRLVAVTTADAEETAKMFDVLLGDAIQDRKRFIAENGHLYIKDADI